MPICSVRSRNPAPRAAAVDVTAQLGSGPWRLVVYFASPSYDQAELARALQDLLPGTRTIGCSTSGEIATGQMLQGSLVVLALGDDDLERVEVEVAEDIRDPASVHDAVDGLEARLGDLRALDAHVGIVLMDGLSGAEESVMQVLGERSTIPFVGGSAGDDLAFRRTWVHADGASRSGTAVLAVLRPTRGFQVLSTRSFVLQGRRLTATEVDEGSRTVRAFDGRDAVAAYADALGVPARELPTHFARHPLGQMVGEEPHVCSPQQVVGSAVRFYRAVREGAELAVLTSTDLLDDTRTMLEAAVATEPASGLLSFDGVPRTLELERSGLTDAYGAVFSEIPTAGFATYGEAYRGHVNQTATMPLFR
jgi:hypothetical protein